MAIGSGLGALRVPRDANQSARGAGGSYMATGKLTKTSSRAQGPLRTISDQAQLFTLQPLRFCPFGLDLSLRVHDDLVEGSLSLLFAHLVCSDAVKTVGVRRVGLGGVASPLAVSWREVGSSVPRPVTELANL